MPSVERTPPSAAFEFAVALAFEFAGEEDSYPKPAGQTNHHSSREAAV
jgi:hypothetical protein